MLAKQTLSLTHTHTQQAVDAVTDSLARHGAAVREEKPVGDYRQDLPSELRIVQHVQAVESCRDASTVHASTVVAATPASADTATTADAATNYTDTTNAVATTVATTGSAAILVARMLEYINHIIQPHKTVQVRSS